MSNVFERLSSKKSFTGMYAERFAHPGHDEEDHDYVLHNDALFRENLHHGRTRIGDVKRKDSTHHVLTSEESLHIRHRDNNPPPDDYEGKLRYVFDYYCAYALGATDAITELGTLNYIRFCKETPRLMGRPRPLNRTDLDLIFTKAKNKHDKKLKFSNFLDALTAMAVHKYPRENQKTAFTYFLAKIVFQNPVLTGKPIAKGGASPRSGRKKKKTSPRRSPRSETKASRSPRIIDDAAKSPLPPSSGGKSDRQRRSKESPRARPVAAQITEVPMGVGVRIGARGADTLEVGLFVDLCCAHSKALLRTILGEVYPRVRNDGMNVSFVFYHFSQPWSSSLALNEVAIAVRQVAPEKYADFCLAALEHQEDFMPSASYRKSRAQIHVEATAIGKNLGIDQHALMSKLTLNARGENAVGPTVRAACLYAIQNGVRATPTATINGLVDFYIFHDWTCDQWMSYIASFR